MFDRLIRAFLVGGGVSAACAWTWPGAFPEADPVAVLVRYHTPNVYRAGVAWYDVAPGVAVFLPGQFLISTSRDLVRSDGRPCGAPVPPSDVAAFAYGRRAGHRRRRCPSPGQSHREPGARMADDPGAGPLYRRGDFGAVGSGKTSACMHPFARQLLSWQATNPERRAAALVLEVKGDFCHDIRRMLTELDRGGDYIELSLDGRLTWNPLSATWLDSYSLAYTVASPLESTLRQGQRTLLAPGWRNPKHVQNWQASLTRHAFPRIGDVPGSELTTADVIEALRPIPAAITIAVLLVEPSREL